MAARLLAALLAVLAVSACGGGAGGETSTDAAATAAWAATLADLDLEADQDVVDVSATGDAPQLEVTIAVPAGGEEITFADGLYGVLVYSYADGRWARTDTAELRTQIAPILGPGESATVTVPVEEAGMYRVLVPAGGRAAWVDVG